MIKKHKRKHVDSIRRTSRIYLRDANKAKVEEVKNFLNLYQNAVNYYIVRFWSSEDIDENLATKEITTRK